MDGSYVDLLKLLFHNIQKIDGRSMTDPLFLGWGGGGKKVFLPNYLKEELLGPREPSYPIPYTLYQLIEVRFNVKAHFMWFLLGDN